MASELTQDARSKKELQGWPGSPISEPIAKPDGFEVNQQRITSVHNDAPFALDVKFIDRLGRSPLAMMITCSGTVSYLDDRNVQPFPQSQREDLVAVPIYYAKSPKIPQEYIISSEHPFRIVEIDIH